MTPSVCVLMSGCRESKFICLPGRSKKAFLGESYGYIVLLVCRADVRIVWRYSQTAAEKCNLSNYTGPGYKSDFEKEEKQQEIASGLSCRRDL